MEGVATDARLSYCSVEKKMKYTFGKNQEEAQGLQVNAVKQAVPVKTVD